MRKEGWLYAHFGWVRRVDITYWLGLIAFGAISEAIDMPWIIFIPLLCVISTVRLYYLDKRLERYKNGDFS